MSMLVTTKYLNSDLLMAPTKIVCVLRNYLEHAKELNSPVPEKVKFFLKPPSSLLANEGTVIIPDSVGSLHHEVELAVLIGKRGRFIPEDEVKDHVLAYTIMLDMTARDLQSNAKKAGLPWTEAKGYDTFAPFGPRAYPPGEFDWHDKRIWLDVNGERRQEGNTDEMLFSVERIISEVSEVMTIEPGDIFCTGTPPGVGAVRSGDKITAGIDGMEPLTVTVQ
ncbi:MAG: fumarylacetoacetate hydrolase family protein [Candidatus Thermoplasmatota archaeon]|jgi:2-keto-4-pentenoate hydratase/2-oxohepta-3-ene-1,7-dioic acid hydratase in catechol pathway|nr:fumarylacetoacetate hydrolase family protein [Candidatus Thermoplasmatota archaeon]MDP7264151.1 fumarylacetoacetate hydrolase family protein [Candidatus Thermoplasmatota archaeon]